MNASAVLQDPRVTYKWIEPKDDLHRMALTSGTFEGFNAVDPYEALRAIIEFRAEAPNLQLAAWHLHLAESRAEAASRTQNSAHLDAMDSCGLWPGVEAYDPPSLHVGKATQVARLRFEQVEQIVRAAAQRDLRKANRSIEKLKNLVPDRLKEACFWIGRPLLDIDHAPIALTVPVEADARHGGLMAQGYERLSHALHISRFSDVSRQFRTAVARADRELTQCRHALRVLGAWIRALDFEAASPVCEYCYRHRATKKALC
ncbi:hypothetical protein [Variovorax sp. E3]|uniref:hypothetical protein n=1 Tax=Variovorax sp. E3 TaxID=1914993 RepID=UPI0018DBFDF9|nr:hypothetical protein [Variovorax sp. E3]